MLYTNIQSQGLLGSGEEEIVSVSIIYGHGGHPVQLRGTI